jgi:hypothetical protein
MVLQPRWSRLRMLVSRVTGVHSYLFKYLVGFNEIQKLAMGIEKNIFELISEASASSGQLNIPPTTEAIRTRRCFLGYPESIGEMKMADIWGRFPNAAYEGAILATDLRVGRNPREISSTIPEIDTIDKLFKVQKPDKVKQFLSGNKTLVKMISSIYAKIRKEFPSENIILDAVSDSPLSREKDIVISVSTSLSVDEAIERLDRVEDVRWDKGSKDPYVDICVKLKYQ